MESANASISALRNDVSTVDTSLRSDVSTLTNYIDTTVARINAIESLAIDTSAYGHDTLLAYGIHLDSSLNQYDSHLDASLNEYDSHLDASLNEYDTYINDTLNQFGAHLDSSLSQYYTAFDERDIVIARSLSQHDASILDLIARVTALENA